MINYLLLHRATYEDGWRFIEGEQTSITDFLKEIDDHVLNENDWSVYEINASYHKDELVADGTIDGVTEE